MNQQEFQQKLQKLSKPYQEQYHQLYKEWQDNTIAVFTQSSEFPRYRQIAMLHTNENRLGVDYTYWRYLFDSPISEYRYNDIICICAACDALTLKDWLTTYPYSKEAQPKMLVDWTEFREYLRKVEDEVNPVIEEKTFSLLDKLLRTQHLDISGQAKTIPLDHKVNPLLNKR